MTDATDSPAVAEGQRVLSGRRLLWGIPALLYAVFVFWYTNTEGALSPEEVDEFAVGMAALGMPAEQVTHWRRFMEGDTGRQFLMVNLLHMRDTPGPVPGAPPLASAAEAMDRYMAHMYPQLIRRASHPVFAGNAVFESLDLVGIEGAEVWGSGALVRYRSRRDLAEIATHPATIGRHDFKVAALEKTIAFPVETALYLSDARLLLALVLLAGVALLDLVIYRRKPTA